MFNLKTLLLSSTAILLSACGSGTGANEDATANAVADSAGEIAKNADVDLELTKTSAAEATTDPSPEAVANLALSKAYLEENAKKEGVITLDNGLQYEMLKRGDETTTPLAQGDLVEFHYTLTNIFDKKEITSSRARHNGESVQLLFDNNIIPVPNKIAELPEIRVGDTIRFAIPSDLAFGERGTPDGEIGPNQAWEFEIQVEKITDAETFQAQLEAEREARRIEFEKVAEENLKSSEAFLAKNAKRSDVVQTDSGLQYRVISSGDNTGKSPAATDSVSVHYKGTLRNGTVFDSSYERGAPTSFPLNGVISGWTEGLQLMKPGDKFEFFIPSDLAYGERGGPGGGIGPNEALIFEVELLEIK